MSDGIHCPKCGSAQNKVTNSRPAENGIRRRRECTKCLHRFTTFEPEPVVQGRTLKPAR